MIDPRIQAIPESTQALRLHKAKLMAAVSMAKAQPELAAQIKRSAEEGLTLAEELISMIAGTAYMGEELSDHDVRQYINAIEVKQDCLDALAVVNSALH